MTRELDNLVAARQLKAEPGSPQEVATLLQRAASLLTDAGNATLSPASRYSLAYDAAFALATAALRLREFRPDATRGHRSVMFQALPHTVDAPRDLWTALTAAHDRRNAIEYSAHSHLRRRKWPISSSSRGRSTAWCARLPASSQLDAPHAMER